MFNIEIIGWIATVFFAISAAPQAFKAIKEGHSKGLSVITLILWYLGEWLMFWYAIVRYPTDYILLINYFANIILLSIIVKYKFFPRKVK